MAKREEPQKVVTRKMVARQERESRQTRNVMMAVGAVLGVILLVLIIGGINEGLVKPAQPVARVDGVNVTTDEYQARVRYQRRNLVAQYLNTLETMSMFAQDQQALAFFQNSLDQIDFQLDPTTLGRDVLNTLIQDKLIMAEAARLGLTVTEAEIDEGMERFFGFFEGGTPTPTTAPTTGPTSTLSPLQLTLITPAPTFTPTATIVPGAEPTATPVVESTDPTPTPFTREGYQTLVKDTVAALNRDISFDEKDLRAIVRANLFREKVFDALTADIERVQDQVWARHILVEDDNTAQAVLTMLANGDDFAEVARVMSVDAGSGAQGGDLGWFGKNRMVMEFEDAAFSLEIGEISEPVQSEFGIHIIQVLGREMRPLSAAQFDTTREAEFQTWLTAAQDGANVVIEDHWENRTPTEPSIPPGYADAYLSQFLLDPGTTPVVAETPAP